MIKQYERNRVRTVKHKRVRKKVQGTSLRPRLSIYRSINEIYCQVIDDQERKTLASTSSISKELRSEIKNPGNIEGAKIVGKKIAEVCKAKGIETVVFDRGGFLYHGRVKALAEAAREAGLKF